MRTFAISKEALENLEWVAGSLEITPDEVMERLARLVQPGRAGRLELAAEDDERDWA